MTEDHLKEIFGCFGKVKDVVLNYRYNTRIPNGTATIEVENPDELQNFITGMNNGQIDGLCLLILFICRCKDICHGEKRRGGGEGQGVE